MSRRKSAHRTAIKRVTMMGKRMYHLTCPCGFFQYCGKGEAQRIGREHLDKKEALGEKVKR